MASRYLPVLLVSVSTNAVPDDSALVTLPRGQVDYLSHDWQEEDVWRSWRNMTRQKNEIANGARLENASWRTWWKQRNKLKTISPETLNWLKDSDVTWLYGPLHTAVEWTPPPKPAPIPDDLTSPAPASDRLGLSVRPRTKPILKHRSISELLTSDFPPTSPVFSPAESDDDDDGVQLAHAAGPAAAALAARLGARRPVLPHTKSDTHITRWGASRAFRPDSPPRIDPPGFAAAAAAAPEGLHPSVSQDSTSSGGGGGAPKKKHISFNTFVEQYIAVEKPKKNASGFFGVGNHDEDGVWIAGRAGFVDDDGYDEDQEDSGEEDEEAWDAGRVVRSDSDEESVRGAIGVIDEDEEEEDDDDEADDDVLEMRSTRSHSSASSSNRTLRAARPPTATKKPPRSQSVSTASSSSSASTSTSTTSATSATTAPSSSSSRSPARRAARRKGSPPPAPGAHDPDSIPRRRRPTLGARARTASSQHVTIAPIAPTLLKTGGAWAEGFGDEGASDDGLNLGLGLGGLYSAAYGLGGSASYSGAMDGSWAWNEGRARPARSAGEGRAGRGEEEASDGTPVELVYAPPRGSGYARSAPRTYSASPGAFHSDYGGGGGEGGGYFAAAEPGYDGGMSDGAGFGYAPGGYGNGVYAGFGRTTVGGAPRAVPDGAEEERVEDAGLGAGGSMPIGISGAGAYVEEEDAQDFFGGEYFYARRGGRGYEPGPAEAHALAAHAQAQAQVLAQSQAHALSAAYAQAQRAHAHRARGSDARRTGSGGGAVAISPPGAAARGRDDGDDARGRGRGRSHSRTPSPALLGAAAPVASGPVRGANASLSPDSALLGHRGGSPNINAYINNTPTNNTNTPFPTTTPTATTPTVPVPGRRRSASASAPVAPASWMSAAAALPPSAHLLPPALALPIPPPPPPASSSSIAMSPPAASFLAQGRPSVRTQSPPIAAAQPARTAVSPAQQQQAPQTERRGRSSTRTPSAGSASWERDASSRGASIGSSPLGSLSPDATAHAGRAQLDAVLGGAGALAGSGRVVDREGERGRERRGRERTSGKVLAGSVAASPPVATAVVDAPRMPEREVYGEAEAEAEVESASVADEAASSAGSSTAPRMSVSISSGSSSATSATVTRGPRAAGSVSAASVSTGDDDEDEDEEPSVDVGSAEMRTAASVEAEAAHLRRAEEEQRRRVHPTPSNSPVVGVRRMAPAGVGAAYRAVPPSVPAPSSTTPPPAAKARAHVRGGSSGGSTPTADTPRGQRTPSPAISTHAPSPSTHSTSASSPTASSPSPRARTPSAGLGGIGLGGISLAGIGLAGPGTAGADARLRPPPLISPPAQPAKPSTSFTAVSSPRGALPAGGALVGSTSTSTANRPTSPTAGGGGGAETIVGKAVDMMSSAGAYLRLWGRDEA